MTERVYGLSGKAVVVASPGGSVDVPLATATTAGLVKATIPVDDVQTIPVTDIASAQSAIEAMGTTLHELMQALRNAGVMEK